jgi:hypothetical protein
MGLDMYIFKVKKTKHTIDELHELDRELRFLDRLDYPDTFKDYYTIFQEVAYWRKFNALHNWFVTNIQTGIDNCSLYEIDKDVLFELLEILEDVYHLKNPSKLPPTQGFFWGSTEVDDYYWDKVESSIQTISKLIDDTDWNNERLFYQASW